jgi:hypothetical protein
MKFGFIVIIALLAILLASSTLDNLLANANKPQVVSQAASASASPHVDENELLNVVRMGLGSIETRKLTHPKPGNFYSQQHDSDLHDERSDLSSYFDIQQSVPDTKALLREITRSSGSCSGGIDEYGQCLPVSPNLKDAQSGNPLKFSFGSDGSATLMPDHWTYQNENVMNGGLVDGVRAFDGQLSNLTVYPSGDATKPEGLWTTSYPYTQTFGKW